MTFRALIGQVMGFEPVTAFSTAHERRNFGQSKFGLLRKAAFLFHNVETETDVVTAMAGQWIKANPDGFDTLGLLGGGLFLDSIDDIADKVNFMHKLRLICSLLQCAVAIREEPFIYWRNLATIW